MAEVQTLSAALRDRAGKGAARQSRRDGLVPGVVYGAKQDPLLIKMQPQELMRELRRTGFFTRIFDLKVGEATEHVLPRDVQFDPVSDKPIHVDFLRVSDTATIQVMVPVVFKNEGASPGLKRGGVLNVVRHEISLICRVNAIPHSIEIDLSGRDIGDSVHISEIGLPDGVRPEIRRDFTVATIGAPSAVKSEAQEAQAAAAAAALAPVAAPGELGAPGAVPAAAPAGATPAAGAAPAKGAAPAEKQPAEKKK
jgi:large subunit ribosomal protein L25